MTSALTECVSGPTLRLESISLTHLQIWDLRLPMERARAQVITHSVFTHVSILPKNSTFNWGLISQTASFLFNEYVYLNPLLWACSSPPASELIHHMYWSEFKPWVTRLEMPLRGTCYSPTFSYCFHMWESLLNVYFLVGTVRALPSSRGQPIDVVSSTNLPLCLIISALPC